MLARVANFGKTNEKVMIFIMDKTSHVANPLGMKYFCTLTIPENFSECWLQIAKLQFYIPPPPPCVQRMPCPMNTCV